MVLFISIMKILVSLLVSMDEGGLWGEWLVVQMMGSVIILNVLKSLEGYSDHGGYDVCNVCGGCGL